MGILQLAILPPVTNGAEVDNPSKEEGYSDNDVEDIRRYGKRHTRRSYGLYPRIFVYSPRRQHQISHLRNQ